MQSCWSTPKLRLTSPRRSWVVFDVQVVFEGSGRTDLLIEGPEQACQPFLNESGGHRWQRIPPTERSGRVHTSTVTVAVMTLTATPSVSALRDSDLLVETCRGRGAGGQHRNKTESAVRMVHRPTGIEVRICAERSQHRNRELAREILTARVLGTRSAAAAAVEADQRRQLVGSGQRGDKCRTYRCRDNQVIDHRTGGRWTVKEFLKGRLS